MPSSTLSLLLDLSGFQVLHMQNGYYEDNSEHFVGLLEALHDNQGKEFITVLGT